MKTAGVQNLYRKWYAQSPDFRPDVVLSFVEIFGAAQEILSPRSGMGKSNIFDKA